MALKGIKVLEIAGLAPGPFCGMVLSDFGASVIRIDKVGLNNDFDSLANGKRSVTINMKSPKGIKVFQRLSNNADVLVEPFRKGVMERLGLGPDVLLKHNPRLVYARLSGFGQDGEYSSRAGHDINYVAMSGMLSILGGEASRPLPPLNLAADFAGGGLMCVLGILLALLERNGSQRGQVVDCSMVAGTAYLSSWIMRIPFSELVRKGPRGQNVLDGGAHYYCTYETKDGEWMSVGAIEPQFYKQLLQGLELQDVPQFTNDYKQCQRILAERFKQKTREEWCQIFKHLDACVAPVLSLDEAPMHPHNVAIKCFASGTDVTTPNPAPLLSRTPGQCRAHLPLPRPGQHTREVLTEAGLSPAEITDLVRQGVVSCCDSQL